MREHRRPFLFVSVGIMVTIPLVLAGCTPEKARQLQTAAAQFRANAQDAIAAVRDLMGAEIAPPARTEGQKADQFSSNILSLPESNRIDGDMMDMAIDPYTVRLSSSEVAAQNSLLDGLSQQYSMFAAMFDDLEAGSFLARKKVGMTKQYAVTLTAQMAGIAKNIAENPPRLIQQRTAVVVQVDKVRRDQTLTPDQKRQALSDLMGRWLDVKGQETAIQKSVVSKCLIAASSGQSVLRLTDSYNRLSVDDITRLTTDMLSMGERITGKNLDDLKSLNEKVLSFLQSNPEYKALADSAITKVQGQFK